MKTLKRILLAAIVLILLLGLGAYVAVKIALPEGKIRALISAKGSDALGRQVEVGDINVRVFPEIKVTVEGVKVANAPGFSADPMMQLRELDLSLNFFSLLRFAPVIQEIKLVSPEILYEVDAEGRNNLEGLGKQGAAASTAAKPSAPAPAGQPLEIPAAVALKSFVIADGSVRYRDAKSGRELTLGRINQEVSLELDPRLQDVVSVGHLEVTEISVRDSASGLHRGDLKIYVNHDFRLDLPGELLQIKKLELAFQDIHVEADGSVSHFRSAAPEVDLRVSAPAIALASVLKEVPATLSPEIPKLTAGGQASFQARIRGKIDSTAMPEIEAQVRVRDGALRHTELPLGVEHLQLDAALSHDSLRLAQLSFDMGRNPVRVEALVTDVRKIPHLEKLMVNAVLDLGGLSALAQKMGMLDPKIGASGTETIKLQASGPLDPANPQKLSATGTVELKGVSLALPGKPSLRADGKVQISNDRIREQLSAKVGQSDLSLNIDATNYLALVLPKLAKGGRTHVQVDIKSGLLDLDPFMPPPGSAPDENASAASASATAAAAPPLKAYPPLPPVDADVSMKLGRTRFMGLEMTQFQLQVTERAKEINTSFKGLVCGGTLSSSTKLTPVSPSNMAATVKLDVAHVEANQFLAGVKTRIPLKNRLFKSVAQSDSLIFGKLNLNVDATTHGLPQQFSDNLAGTVVFSLTDGKLLESGLTRGFSGALSKVNSALGFHQLTFGSIKGDAKIENGKLTVRDFSMDSSPIGSVNATGTVGFDNVLNLQLTHALTPGLSKIVGGAAGAVTRGLAKLAPVPGLGDVSLLPKDKNGHVLLYFTAGGILSKPTFALDSHRMAKEGASGSSPSTLSQKKEEVKAKVETAVKSEAKQEAKTQAKKVLKRFGF